MRDSRGRAVIGSVPCVSGRNVATHSRAYGLRVDQSHAYPVSITATSTGEQTFTTSTTMMRRLAGICQRAANSPTAREKTCQLGSVQSRNATLAPSAITNAQTRGNLLPPRSTEEWSTMTSCLSFVCFASQHTCAFPPVNASSCVSFLLYDDDALFCRPSEVLALGQLL